MRGDGGAGGPPQHSGPFLLTLPPRKLSIFASLTKMSRHLTGFFGPVQGGLALAVAAWDSFEGICFSGLSGPFSLAVSALRNRFETHVEPPCSTRFASLPARWSPCASGCLAPRGPIRLLPAAGPRCLIAARALIPRPWPAFKNATALCFRDGLSLAPSSCSPANSTATSNPVAAPVRRTRRGA